MNFQTPKTIVDYMISKIPNTVNRILEPTPGDGNIVNALTNKGFDVIAPVNFWDWKHESVDCVVMNPPFTARELIYQNAPEYIKKLKGATVGYWFLFKMMELSDVVIALMPWYTIINSGTIRTNQMINFGLVSVTNLPRSIFKVRIQACILHLEKGFKGKTEFINFIG